jgi:hypothetical protein
MQNLKMRSLKTIIPILLVLAILGSLLPAVPAFADGGEIGSLNITSVLPGYNSGTVTITLGSAPGEGNSFVYKISDSEVNGLTPGSTITDGINILPPVFSLLR